MSTHVPFVILSDGWHYFPNVIFSIVPIDVCVCVCWFSMEKWTSETEEHSNNFELVVRFSNIFAIIEARERQSLNIHTQVCGGHLLSCICACVLIQGASFCGNRKFSWNLKKKIQKFFTFGSFKFWLKQFVRSLFENNMAASGRHRFIRYKN